MKPTLEQVQKLIGSFDTKYRRVKKGRFIATEDATISPIEVLDELRELTANKPTGKYKFVHAIYPVLDDLDIKHVDEEDDVEIEAAYEEFDRLMSQVLVGKSENTLWVVPPDDERYDNEEVEVGILFTD